MCCLRGQETYRPSVCKKKKEKNLSQDTMMRLQKVHQTSEGDESFRPNSPASDSCVFLHFLSSPWKCYSHEICEGVCLKVVVAALSRSPVQARASVPGWICSPENPEAFFWRGFIPCTVFRQGFNNLVLFSSLPPGSSWHFILDCLVFDEEISIAFYCHLFCQRVVKQKQGNCEKLLWPLKV